METFKSLWKILWNTVEWVRKHIKFKKENKSIHSGFQEALQKGKQRKAHPFLLCVHNMEEMAPHQCPAAQTPGFKSRGCGVELPLAETWCAPAPRPCQAFQGESGRCWQGSHWVLSVWRILECMFYDLQCTDEKTKLQKHSKLASAPKSIWRETEITTQIFLLSALLWRRRAPFPSFFCISDSDCSRMLSST